MVSQQKLKALEDTLARASSLAEEHGYAVREAEEAFMNAFGAVVPEEMGICSGAFASSEEEVGGLFNNFVNHSENLSSGNTVKDLVSDMVKLMGKKR